MIKQTIENFGGNGGDEYHHSGGNGYHHYGHHRRRRYRNRDYIYFYNNVGYYNNINNYCDKDKIILNDKDLCYNRSENEIDNCHLKSCNIEKYDEKKCKNKIKCSLVGIC